VQNSNIYVSDETAMFNYRKEHTFVYRKTQKKLYTQIETN